MSERELDMMQQVDEGKLMPECFKISDETTERMGDALVNNINAVVKEDDTLWHLGDFCFGPYAVARRYRDRINCHNVHIIWGNHDRKDKIRDLFDKACDQRLIKVKDQKIFLNHFPMRSWDCSHHGSWSLYGHVHGLFYEDDLATPNLTLDMGVDCAQRYSPWSFEEIAAHMATKMPAWLERKIVNRKKAPRSSLKNNDADPKI